MVVGPPSHVQAASAGDKRKLNVARAFGQSNACVNWNLRLFLMRSFDLLPDFTFQILLLQFLFELAKGGINRNPGGKNVDFGFDLHGRQRSIAIVIDVIDCRRQDFSFQALGNFRWRLRVRAPFDFQFQMMRRDAPSTLLLPHALVNQPVHPVDELIGCEPGLRIDSTTELAIDYIANAFQNASHYPLRQDRVAPALRWILFVSHESEYENPKEGGSMPIIRW